MDIISTDLTLLYPFTFATTLSEKTVTLGIFFVAYSGILLRESTTATTCPPAFKISTATEYALSLLVNKTTFSPGKTA